MTPIVDGLETEFNNQIAFQRINANTGQGPEVMQAYHIPGHPAILIINPNGEEITRFIGPQSTEILSNALQQLISTEE